VGARAAGDGADRVPPGLARGLSASAQRRVGARRVAPQCACTLARGEAADRGRVRASAKDLRELARARRCGAPRARRRGTLGHRPCCRGARRGALPAGVRRARRGAAVIGAAPAKINLGLVVGPMRPDGKHELLTIYQRVDLSDRIRVEPAGATTVEGFSQDTLVRRALAALDGSRSWRIRIDKRIPVAAGLGGGSSDAATALRLANTQLDEPLGPESL